jgi:hypothetical protein
VALLCRSHVVRNHATLVTGADGVTGMPVRSAHCYLRTRFRRESARLPDKLRAEMNSISTHTGGVVTTDNDLAAGQSWAYRARQVDDVVEVEVLKLGTQRPPRVLVHFGDERFEGRQEWVPPARLKVRWEAVDAFRASEARWDRVFDLGRGFDDPADGAATEVFTALIADDIARMEYREAGACRITDSGRLTELTGLDAAVWTQCPEGFTEGPDLGVPWPVTEQIAAAAARRNPAPILEAVHNEEGEARYHAVHGHCYRGRGSRSDRTIPAEICIKVDNRARQATSGDPAPVVRRGGRRPLRRVGAVTQGDPPRRADRRDRDRRAAQGRAQAAGRAPRPSAGHARGDAAPQTGVTYLVGRWFAFIPLAMNGANSSAVTWSGST